METAICSRIALSPNYVVNPKPGVSSIYDCSCVLISVDKLCQQRGSCANRGILMARSLNGSGRGGSLWGKPTEKTTPGFESEFDLKKSRKTAPPFRVILHNDNHNNREYVLQVLIKVIPGMHVDNAFNILQEAHHSGLAVVIICPQPDAEEHCMQLRSNGLLSSIDPASGGR